MHRAVQRGDEHGAAKAYPLSARGRVAHDLQWAQERHDAERLLQRPGALEAERLGARHVGPEASGVELTVGNELRDGDRKSHVLAPVHCGSDRSIDVTRYFAAALNGSQFAGLITEQE